MNTIELEVQGMSCDSCVKHVTQALKPLTGVSSVEVELQSGHVRVSGEFPQGSDAMVTALSAAGYPAHLATATEATAQPKVSGCQSGRAGKDGCCCG